MNYTHSQDSYVGPISLKMCRGWKSMWSYHPEHVSASTRSAQAFSDCLPGTFIKTSKAIYARANALEQALIPSSLISKPVYRYILSADLRRWASWKLSPIMLTRTLTE